MRKFYLIVDVRFRGRAYIGHWNGSFFYILSGVVLTLVNS
jgi:hypothetical protein